MNQYESYRKHLLQAGFLETLKKPGRFYRLATDRTIFFLNLKDWDSAVWVLYGFALFSPGYEGWIRDYGCDESEGKLRNALTIESEEAPADAEAHIQEFYNTYSAMGKDDLCKAARERQKAFLNQITARLKPLGFRKRAAKWYLPISDRHLLVLEAQRSQYSDQFYFNIYISHDLSHLYISSCQYSDRVVWNGSDIFNWQLLTPEQIDNLLTHTVQTKLLPIINQYHQI